MQDIRQLDFENIFFYQKNELCMVHLVLFIFTLHKVRYFKISLTVILLLSYFTNADFIYTQYSFIQTDDRKPSVSIQWAGALKCSYHSYLASSLKLSFLSVEHILCTRRPIFPVSSSTIFPVILRILIRSLQVLPVSFILWYLIRKKSEKTKPGNNIRGRTEVFGVSIYCFYFH